MVVMEVAVFAVVLSIAEVQLKDEMVEQSAILEVVVVAFHGAFGTLMVGQVRGHWVACSPLMKVSSSGPLSAEEDEEQLEVAAVLEAAMLSFQHL